METYAKQSKPSVRTISAQAGHGRADVAGVLQAYRNRTAQLAALTDEEEQTLQGKLTTQLQEEEDETVQGKFVTQLQEEEEMLQGKFAVQLQPDDEEEPLQGKFLTQRQSAEEEEPLLRKAENRTGLPDQLKSGVENLSGYSLDAVKVHKNSPRPAQLQALAYTQGTDIHVGPGQERYLGHEAWHVVQQMQGRVQPTTQLQGIAVNDNEGLEREADVMGEKALTEDSATSASCYAGNCTGDLIQRVSDVQNITQNLPYTDPMTGLIANQLAGRTMEAYLDPLDPLCGSAPGDGGNYALYHLLITNYNIFVKGHLLNDNLGGPGIRQNLFPMTQDANHKHSDLVEEPVKAGLLALARNSGVLANGTGFGGVGVADRIHYVVAATWWGGGEDFLANPQSQLDCYAEFIDAAGNSVSPIADTTITSVPGVVAANNHNDDLNSIGWGHMGIGTRIGANAFVVGPGAVPGQWIIQGPQWDNTNTLMPAPKVYITYT